MHSDDVSDSLDNGEIFEFVGIENEGGIVAGVTCTFGVLEEKGVINDFQGANVSIFVSFVGEGGIDNNRVKMLGILGGKLGLAQLRIFVL